MLNKYRVIHDLSWPPGESVNDFINGDCSVEYISIDTVAQLVKKKFPHCYMAKLDLEDAYKFIMVRPEDWDLLGSSWVNDEGHIEYYVDLVLNFGLRSAPLLFNMFATALEFIMSQNGVTDVVHYLDDYFTCGPAQIDICQSFDLPWWPSCLDRGALNNVDAPGCGRSVVRGPTGHK